MTIIHDYPGKPGTLHEFADNHKLVLIVRCAYDIYYAKFSNTLVMGTNRTQFVVEGAGDTVQEAINDYARQISGVLLRIITSTKGLDDPSVYAECIPVPTITGE